MSFFFKHFPRIDYDIGKLDTSLSSFKQATNIQNPLVRFKLKDILKDKAAIYYTHDVGDSETAEFIARRYYEDETLDWVIYIVNDIIDPLYDWPLQYNSFIEFINKKYGTTVAARQQIHHYEELIQERQILFDGTIVPERYIEIDQTRYDTLSELNKRTITQYEYEEQLNEAKRTIKVLHRRYINQFLSEARDILA